MSAVLNLSTIALLQPIGVSSSDLAINILEPISRVLAVNSWLFLVLTFIVCIPMLAFSVRVVVDAIRLSKKERKSDD